MRQGKKGIIRKTGRVGGMRVAWILEKAKWQQCGDTGASLTHRSEGVQVLIEFL